MLEKRPFVNYTLDEDKTSSKDILTIRLNNEERLLLEQCKQIICQKKDSTALKTIFLLGAKVLHEPKTSYLIELLFKNKRNNQRNNVVDFD